MGRATRPLNILNYGDCIRPENNSLYTCKTGVYKLHSKFENAVNFVNNEIILSLVTQKTGNGPVNLLTDSQNLPAINFKEIEVYEQKVVIQSENFFFDNLKKYDSSFSFDDLNYAVFYKNLELLKKRIIQNADEFSLAFLLDATKKTFFKTKSQKYFVNKVETAVKELFSGNASQGLMSLKGTGFGLTPSGDDFIAGFLTAIHLLENIHKKSYKILKNKIFRLVKSENLLVNSFLELITNGFFQENLKILLIHIIKGNQQQVIESGDRFMRYGATSGSDLLTGIIITLDNFKKFKDKIINIL